MEYSNFVLTSTINQRASQPLSLVSTRDNTFHAYRNKYNRRVPYYTLKANMNCSRVEAAEHHSPALVQVDESTPPERTIFRDDVQFKKQPKLRSSIHKTKSAHPPSIRIHRSSQASMSNIYTERTRLHLGDQPALGKRVHYLLNAKKERAKRK